MQRFRIAGLTVDIDVKYERLKKQGKAYEIPLDDSKPDFSLELTEKVMEKARVRFPNLTDGEIEYILYGYLFSDKLLDYSGIMVHSSAVGLGGYAYLFSADSGVGKSTHTSFYLELFGDKAVIINDDKPVLREINGKIYAFGTPFSGKHDISKNAAYELAGICFLSRGSKNTIERITPAEAVRLIYRQTQSFHTKERMEKRLEALDRLLTNSDLYKMECINDISAAKVSYDCMKKSVPVYLEELSELILNQLNDGGSVKFCTKGRSMTPLLISRRDSVVLKKKDEICKNDVILYKDCDGKYILHRVKKINGDKIVTRGDALACYDQPIERSVVIATACGFERKGKEIKVSSLIYKLYVLTYTSSLGLFLRKFRRRLKKGK